MKEYLQELEEMEERVERMPLLLERTAQVIDLSLISLLLVFAYTGMLVFLDIQEFPFSLPPQSYNSHCIIPIGLIECVIVLPARL